jgi:hypothetical protein
MGLVEEMQHSFHAALLVACALTCLSSCDRLKSALGTNDPPDAATTAAASTSFDASDGATGLAECDAYLKQYACYLDKLSPGQSGVVIPNATQKYARAAATPSARAAAATSCAHELETMGDAFARVGCAPTFAAGDPHEPHRGKCHRGDCPADDELCCENTSTGEERCQARATREGKGAACSADGAWRVAMACLETADCAPNETCCVSEPTKGFFQTVCAANCFGDDESCTASEGAAPCKTPNTKCVASPGSRAGGHCAPKAAVKPLSSTATCGPCEGANAAGACVPLCDDDQRCVYGECIDADRVPK